MSERVIDVTGIEWDAAADVIVVGSGAAGFPAALTAAYCGASVLLLEKGATAGGTMRKSGAWHWIPNNGLMREAGQIDDRESFLRYVARLSDPLRFDESAPRLGLPEWEWAMFNAFYDNAATAVSELAAIGALKSVYSPLIPDYLSHLEEPRLRYGRTLRVTDGGNGIGSGEAMMEQYLRASQEADLPLLYEHRVDGIVVDHGEVVGVRAQTPSAAKWIGARQGVIFCSGGFTHSEDRAARFWRPTWSEVARRRPTRATSSTSPPPSGYRCATCSAPGIRRCPSRPRSLETPR